MTAYEAQHCRWPVNKLAAEDGPNFTRLEQQGGVLSRQMGELIPSCVLRRKAWYNLMLDTDSTLQLPEAKSMDISPWKNEKPVVWKVRAQCRNMVFGRTIHSVPGPTSRRKAGARVVTKDQQRSQRQQVRETKDRLRRCE